MNDRLRFDDSHVKIYCGDSRNMRELLDESVQCVVTSPPYWGLRKYKGNQDLVWGGDSDCSHKWEQSKAYGRIQKDWSSGVRGVSAESLSANYDNKFETASSGSLCIKCGATKVAFGLESTPEEYITHSVLLLREIRRVLRNDGVVFWNIGDSYWGGKGQSGQGSPEYQASRQDVSLNKPYHQTGGEKQTRPADGKHSIIKPKDMCLIPERLKIALQEDGWWVRSTIIWNKLNPMPESVRDRPTEAHEYILMLTKKANYYWDTEAVREPYTEPLNRWGGDKFRDSSHKYIDMGGHDGEQHFGATSMYREGRPVRPHSNGRNIRSVWAFPTEAFDLNMCEDCGRIYHKAQFKKLQSVKANHRCHCSEDNEDYSPDWEMTLIDDDFLGMRCNLCGEVYTMKEYDKLPKAVVRVCVCGSNNWLSHFAVFPEKLPEICIKAATSEEGCCSKCGKPWMRIIENKWQHQKQSPSMVAQDVPDNPMFRNGHHNDGLPYVGEIKTLGWQPQCKCNADKVPSIVLDPFAGSGTTLWVAKKLGRYAIGYDLTEQYCQLAIEGNRQYALL